MTIWKRVANNGQPRRMLWGAALALGAAAVAGPAAGPRLAAPPDLAGLYRTVPNPLLPVLRREGDSLRIFLNRAAPPAGSAAPRLQLTAWASYEARQPLWQQTLVPRPYPGSDPAAPVQVLTATVAASRLTAGQVLQFSFNPVAAGSASSYESEQNAAASAQTQDAATSAWLALTAERLTRPFVLLDSTGLVLDRPYAPAGSRIAVAVYGLNQPVRWRRYPGRSAAALPPFADPRSQPAAPRTLAVLDSSAAPTAGGQLLRLPEKGLYALKIGGAGGEPVHTLPLLATRADFPGLTSATELIDNLLYLTTAAERKQLAAAPDAKRAVDKFWLQAAGDDQERARELIRRYYGGIVAANELFTGHKSGWLTDRGMLYVVLGPPQSVRRLPGQELWRYDQAGRQQGPVTFTFRARPTTLAPANYELVRRPEYQALWYAAVEQWRRPLSAH